MKELILAITEFYTLNTDGFPHLSRQVDMCSRLVCWPILRILLCARAVCAGGQFVPEQKTKPIL